MIKRKLKTNILVSSIVLFLIGGLLHFSYDFSNQNYFIGLITPINESLFEHLKLSLFSIFSWWLIFYILKREKYNLNKDKWFFGCLISTLLSITIILFIHYFIRYGIGKELIVVDIVSLYFAILVGQLIGYHFYRHYNKINFIFSLAIMILIAATFILLTTSPPQLPLFEDKKSNTYGINNKIKQ